MKSNSLVPELSISDFEKTLEFYTKILGFTIEYQRVDEGFAFLSLGEAQLMIDEIGKTRTWKTEDFQYPLGRGVNLQIKAVENLNAMIKRLSRNKVELFMEPEEKWYVKGDWEVGNRQFLVQDPDGYLLRFFEDLGMHARF